jgi:hypothetical protein
MKTLKSLILIIFLFAVLFALSANGYFNLKDILEFFSVVEGEDSFWLREDSAAYIIVGIFFLLSLFIQLSLNIGSKESDKEIKTLQFIADFSISALSLALAFALCPIIGVGILGKILIILSWMYGATLIYGVIKVLIFMVTIWPFVLGIPIAAGVIMGLVMGQDNWKEPFLFYGPIIMFSTILYFASDITDKAIGNFIAGLFQKKSS